MWLLEGEAAAGQVQELESEVLGEHDERGPTREQTDEQQRTRAQLGEGDEPLHHAVVGQDEVGDDAWDQREVVAAGLGGEDAFRLRAVDEVPR